MLVSFLAILGLAVNVPDVPSGAEHDELYQMAVLAFVPDASPDCAHTDPGATGRQQDKQTDTQKCCGAACSVFGVLSSTLDILEPSVKGTPFVRPWSALFPSDPRNLHRPPKLLT